MASRMSVLKVSMVLLCVIAISVFLTLSSSKTFSQTIFQTIDMNSCPCGKCLSENDTWFMKHFNESVEPFLSAHGRLSEAAFNWWKRLQEERCSINIFNETVNFLFRIFPPNPDVIEPRPRDCRTCAVVGNSVNLKGSGYGPLIDDHDVIIRINHGKTKGYEADVGNRTTHRVMYPESSVDLDDATHLILFPFKIKDIEWLIRVFTTRFPGTKLKTGNKDLVTVLNPAFMKYVHDAWLDKKGSYPSTGFMTLILALHRCSEVDVFGFGADKDGNWSHYFEKLRSKSFKTGIHPGTYEYEMIRELSNKRKINFHSGQ